MEPKGCERHRWIKPRGRDEPERVSQSALADVVTIQRITSRQPDISKILFRNNPSQRASNRRTVARRVLNRRLHISKRFLIFPSYFLLSFSTAAQPSSMARHRAQSARFPPPERKG